MSLIPRSNFTDLDNLFDNFFPTFRFAPDTKNSFFSPQVDIEEKENSYLIKADLPGVKKEDINVTLHDGVLSIDAEHRENSEEKQDGKVIRRERRIGKFSRSFTVGKGIVDSDIQADYTDGLLTLSIPKSSKEEAVRKRISIG